MFNRTINGKTYTSPAHSTRVYEDGSPMPKAAPPVGPLGTVAAPTVSVEGKMTVVYDDRLRAIRKQIQKALSVRKPGVTPVRPGDQGGDADMALREAGFLETRFDDLPPDEMRFTYVSPDATSTLHVVYDRRAASVQSVEWFPRPKPKMGKELTRQPHTWDEFTADLTAYARRIAAEHGGVAAVGSIVDDAAYEGYSGLTDWDGTIHIGETVKRDIEAAAGVKNLTDSQKRAVWSSVQGSHHEVLHAAFPVPKELYDNQADAALEEGLTEQVSHNEVVAVLRKWGMNDVVDWAANHPQDWKVRGTYTLAREQLDAILDRANMPLEEREAFLRRLKLDVKPANRFAVLGAELPGGKHENEQLVRERFANTSAGDDMGFVDHFPLNAEPTTTMTAPEFNGRRLQINDRVMLVGHAGWAKVVGVHEDEFAARWDHGEYHEQLGADEITDIEPSVLRLPGSAGADFHDGHDVYHEGDTVAFDSRAGTTHARIERIVRAATGDWVAEAITVGSGGGTRIALTPSRVRSTMRKEGFPRVPLGPKRNLGFSPGVRLEDKAELRGHFDLPRTRRSCDRDGRSA